MDTYERNDEDLAIWEELNQPTEEPDEDRLYDFYIKEDDEPLKCFNP